MPAIFNEARRAEIRQSLLAAGFDLMRERGLRRLTIDEVTSRAGIAKGTFYSFFPSKEEFVYQIVVKGRTRVATELEELADRAGGKIDRAAFESWLSRMWRDGAELYRAVGVDGWRYLSEKWPRERSFSPDVDREASEWILSKLDGVSPHADWRTFANLQKAIAMLYLNEENVHADALDATVGIIIDAMARALFDAESSSPVPAPPSAPVEGDSAPPSQPH